MKRIIISTLILFISANISIAQKKGTPKTQKEKIGYSIGVDIGKNIKTSLRELDLDREFLFKGIKDGFDSAKTAMTEKEMVTILSVLQQEMNAKMMAKQKVIGEKNKKESEAFLEENKKKEGVVTLPSGLQYKILKNADGPKPTAEQTVECNYTGTLLDGTEFDSSIRQGRPLQFQVNKVIKGWTEALQLMPVGSKWQLFIPSELAYGENSPGQPIGPNSMLIFEVELVSIK